MTDALTEQIKRKLNITWEDTVTDARVSDIKAAAESVMRYKIGIADDATFDFADQGIENVLFLAYCLYMYNHVENEFDENYKGLILQARAIHEVADDAADEVENDGTE